MKSVKPSIKPDFSFEKEFFDKGVFVIGVDEVGRGALAGPVVAAAAAVRITNRESRILQLGIDDSKRLSRVKREKLEPLIKKYFYFGIGEAEVEIINKKGIVYATRLAMKRALRQAQGKPDKNPNQKLIILIDGRRVKGIGRQRAIVKGDQKSVSIAAASILAKVHRDGLMVKLSKEYVHYGFNDNVGYGTFYHKKMIIKYGICEIHRIKFVETFLKVVR